MATIFPLRAGETRAMRVLLASAAAAAILAPAGEANAHAARASRDIVAEIGQWMVDGRGARHRPPAQAVRVSYASPLVAVADAGPPASPAWRARAAGYDRYGNPPFELAPPPRAGTVAAAIAQAPETPAAETPTAAVDALPQASQVAAHPADAGAPASEIEARVNARIAAARVANEDAFPQASQVAARTSAGEPNPASRVPAPVGPAPARGPLLAFAFGAESAEIDPELAAEIRPIARAGGRIVAVGYAPIDAGGQTRALRLAESRALALRQELIALGAPAAAVAFEARISRDGGEGGHRGAIEREAAPAVAPASAASDMRPSPPSGAPPAAKPASRAASAPLAPPRRTNARP